MMFCRKTQSQLMPRDLISFTDWQIGDLFLEQKIVRKNLFIVLFHYVLWYKHFYWSIMEESMDSVMKLHNPCSQAIWLFFWTFLLLSKSSKKNDVLSIFLSLWYEKLISEIIIYISVKIHLCYSVIKKYDFVCKFPRSVIAIKTEKCSFWVLHHFSLWWKTNIQ